MVQKDGDLFLKFAKDICRTIPCEDCPTLWARFYELETNRPFFCDRDGIKKYDISATHSPSAQTPSDHEKV